VLWKLAGQLKDKPLKKTLEAAATGAASSLGHELAIVAAIERAMQSASKQPSPPGFSDDSAATRAVFCGVGPDTIYPPEYLDQRRQLGAPPPCPRFCPPLLTHHLNPGLDGADSDAAAFAAAVGCDDEDARRLRHERALALVSAGGLAWYIFGHLWKISANIETCKPPPAHT
jgi:hypothetical protein